jgi:hypothetical protein
MVRLEGESSVTEAELHNLTNNLMSVMKRREVGLVVLLGGWPRPLDAIRAQIALTHPK